MTVRPESAVNHKHSIFDKASDLEITSGWIHKLKRASDYDHLPFGDMMKTTRGKWGPVRWFRGSLQVSYFSF